MLAYVFSHQPARGVDVGAYEKALREFHHELASDRPAGFIASTTFHHDAGYSDWYLVEDSSALDVLNSAAVTGSRAPKHDVAAAMATNGAGKLYSLVQGKPDLESLHEVGFSKPAGMAYADLYARIEPFAAVPGAALWRRMMVLGPPPEFCLVAQASVELPSEFKPEPRERRQI